MLPAGSSTTLCRYFAPSPVPSGSPRPPSSSSTRPSGNATTGGGCPADEWRRTPAFESNTAYTDRGERRVEPVAGKAVEPRERRRRLQPLDGDRAQRVPQLPHVRGGLHSLAHDVTDDETESAIAQLDGVEPVSTYVDALRARQVARCDLHPRDTWQHGGQNASLEGLRDRAFRVEVPGSVESLRSLASRESRGTGDRRRRA